MEKIDQVISVDITTAIEGVQNGDKKTKSIIENKNDEEDDMKEPTDEELIDRELLGLIPYHAERYVKMMKVIKEKMKYHKDYLMSKWAEHSNILDIHDLKEIRSDFEATYKSLRHMASEWEKRKHSELLDDHSMNTIYMYFDH